MKTPTSCAVYSNAFSVRSYLADLSTSIEILKKANDGILTVRNPNLTVENDRCGPCWGASNAACSAVELLLVWTTAARLIVSATRSLTRWFERHYRVTLVALVATLVLTAVGPTLEGLFQPDLVLARVGQSQAQVSAS